MKKYILLYLFILCNLVTFSQENNVNQHELGLIFSNLNSFGLRYKHGSDNLYYRVTSLVISGTNTLTTNNAVNSTNNPSNSFGGNLNLGFEKRMWFNSFAYLYYGMDWINSYSWSLNRVINYNSTSIYYDDINGNGVSISTSYSNTTKNEIYSLSSGLGISLGTVFKINEAFSVAIEVEPTITYKFTKTTISNNSYSIDWQGSNWTGFTPYYEKYSNSTTTITRGLTYGATNASASIAIFYNLSTLKKKNH